MSNVPTFSAAPVLVLREVNDRIREISLQWSETGESIDFICECGDSACLGTVRLALPDYEAIRAEELRYVLLPGHHAPTG